MLLRIRICAVYTALLLLLPVLSGCKEKETTGKVAPAKVVKVDTARIIAGDLPVMRMFPGGTVAKESVALAPKMPGYVKVVRVEEGQAVRKGQILLVMDDTDIKARIMALESAVEAAKSQKAAMESRYSYAKSNFRRFSKLFKEDAATREEFDRAESKYRAIKAQVMALDANIKRAQAQLAEAKNQLSYAEIASPVNGWVTRRLVDPGTYVNPGVTVLELDSEDAGVWFKAGLDEALLGSLKKGQVVTLSIPSAGIEGQYPVAQVVQRVNPATRTFVILIDLPERHVRGGLFGRVFVKTGARHAVLLPGKALVNRGGLEGVFVVGHDSILRWRVIKTGRTWTRTAGSWRLYVPVAGAKEAVQQDSIFIEALSGLDPGEVVVTSDLEAVSEGNRLE